MSNPESPTNSTNPLDEEIARLQEELAYVVKQLTTLKRQASKEHTRHNELLRAHELTIANLKEVRRENTTLARERELWRERVERGTRPITFNSTTIEMTSAEVSAIRKAMARLHHPDLGGNIERMKTWNSLLDPLDR